MLLPRCVMKGVSGVILSACGATVWLTGLPSAGKTTIAKVLANRLRGEGRRVEILDGDEVRRFLTAGLGLTRTDRDLNVQRIGLVAEVLSRNGVITLTAVIAPYANSREAVRKRHEDSRTPYFEIHVSTPVSVCSQRDVKGLYARQRTGQLFNLTGIDDPYEPPPLPDLTLPTQDESPEESAAKVYALLASRLPW